MCLLNIDAVLSRVLVDFFYKKRTKMHLIIKK